MRLVIIGTEHDFQDFDEDLRKCIANVMESEHATLICEEYLKAMYCRRAPISIAHQVADSKKIPWVQIDMITEQRIAAGIDAKLYNRMQVRYEADGTVVQRLRYAPKEDGIREEFWLDRIAEEQTEGTALIVCGALHARKLSEKAKQRGHDTKLLFHPENPGSQFWVSITPESF